MTKTTFSDVAWSHSALSCFLECPQKYYREKVTKEVPFIETEALVEGRRIHDALEKCMKEKGRMQPPYEHLQSLADFGMSLPRVEIESEFALTVANGKMEPCGWFDRKVKVWARCKIDVLSWLTVNDKKRALVVDWKTGKYWGPDMQPERTALFLFWYYPELQNVTTVWYYMKPGPEQKRQHFNRADVPRLMHEVIQGLNGIAKCTDEGQWPLTPGKGCKFCGVTSCVNQGKRL